MRVSGKVVWGVVAAVAFALAAACGGGNDSGNGGNPGGPGGGGGGGGGGSSTTTITITNSGVSPKSLTVARGTQVTFTNSSSVTHEMASDPHPTHGSCPEIEGGIGFIQVGQSKQTMNLNTAKTCGYHDHNRDFDTTLQGTITIQ
jgi:plastocyanin